MIEEPKRKEMEIRLNLEESIKVESYLKNETYNRIIEFTFQLKTMTNSKDKQKNEA